MKQIAIIIVYLIISFYCKGQCNKDSIFARKGKWKKEADANVFPDKTFPRSQFGLVNKRADDIYALIKEGITILNGFEPIWYRRISEASYIPSGPVPYELATMYFHYYCNTNIKNIFLGDETYTTVRVFVNRLSWFLYQADTLDINDDGKVRTIYQLPAKDGEINGMTVYKLDTHNPWYNASSIIIGRNGKVPWRSITQKQYLTGLKNQYQKKLASARKNTSSEKDYTDKLKHINDYLSVADEETLQKTAIIDPKSGIWGFKGKFGKEDEGGFRLVLFAGSESYFDRSIPRYAPQLIQLYWSYSREQVSQNIKDQFEKNFPFDKLKAMIDK